VNGANPPKLIISVKEGSILPKDSAYIANQAIDLALANKLSLIDLYKRLEYPNPEELAANVWLEVNAPQLLYANNPLVQQAMGMMAQAKADEESNGLKQEERKGNQEMMKEEKRGEIRMREAEQKSLLEQVKTEK
jgi:hypothetical protein